MSLDLSGLPSYQYGHRGLIWWATMGLIAIEGMAFALAIAAYFYLWSNAPVWPLGEPPQLFWGTLNIAILLVSILPNHLAKRAAEDGDEARVRRWLVLCCLFGVALLGVRALEFAALNVRWDSNAYGSVVWLLLILHTAHLLTDVYDTIVLTVLMFTGPLEGKRHVDVADNAMYWYFVVYAWIPVYAVIYWMPRLT